MAREHLYKAKRIDNGEWLEGNLDKIVYEYPNKTVEEYYINETHFGFQDDDGFDPCYQCGFNEPVDEKTICEYTGLKDKNGTKVFEGDVVKDENGFGCEIIYSDLGCYMMEYVGQVDRFFLSGEAKRCEVIGNKFDNDLEVQDET